MKKSDYSTLDKVFHFIALEVPWLRKFSFELDGLFYGRSESDSSGRHVFVCGLARAGTTAFMRLLYSTGNFRSLTFRDMPFVLMPNIWNALSNKFRMKGMERERVHGDGILVDYDSPEAFEEIFWLTFSGDDYVNKEYCHSYQVSDAVLELFRIYVARIVKQDCVNYLSKNNNNILRVASIRRAFPSAIICIPFRNPLHQCRSLLRQHEKFNLINEQDKFSLRYMKWLGHFEFGLGHKRFVFDDISSFKGESLDRLDINYWLSYWINAYSHLLNTAPVDSLFLGYEYMCNNSTNVIDVLSKMTNVEYSITEFELAEVASNNSLEGVNQELILIANEIYLDMMKRSLVYFEKGNSPGN